MTHDRDQPVPQPRDRTQYEVELPRPHPLMPLDWDENQLSELEQFLRRRRILPVSN